MKTLLACCICILLVSCSSPKKPYFKELQNVKFDSFSLKKPYSVKLRADAVYHNPNALGTNISELDIEVFINDAKTMHLTQEIKATMPPQSDFALPIICEIPLDDVFKNFDTSQLLSSLKIDYRMDGHLKVGLGSANVRVPFSYEGTEPIKIF